MPMKTKIQVLLLLIFLLSVGLRTYYATQTDNFDLDAYFNYRQILHIKETGQPIHDDALSYGGRELLFLPAFHYLMSFFIIFFPLNFGLKLIPNIFASTIVFVVYLFTYNLTKKRWVSLITALFSVFVPIYFVATMNTISSLSIAIPLIFYALYCFMTSKNKISAIIFCVLSFILPLINAASLILVLVFVLFLFLCKIAKCKIERRSVELILFYTFISFWLILLFFKKAFLIHGPSLIWQNIPKIVLDQYFVNITILEAIFSIGLLPLLAGIYVVYFHFGKQNKKQAHLLLSFSILIFLLLWFKLISPVLGLSLLGIIMIIFAGVFLNNSVAYIKKTKLSKLRLLFIVFFIFVLLLNLVSLTAFFARESPAASETDISAMNFLKTTVDDRSGTVVAPYEYGHMINAIAEKPNIADSSFLLITAPEQRIKDINTIYTTPFEVNAISIMQKYDAEYLYVFNKRPKYIESDCFKMIYDRQIKIYRLECSLK